MIIQRDLRGTVGVTSMLRVIQKILDDLKVFKDIFAFNDRPVEFG